MKKFVITENEKRNILGMYGLINEQSSGLNLPNEIFQIITDIEARFSYCKNGIVYGESSYKGNSKLGVFTKYVKGTIGFDTWNKLDNNTKAQIYSFAYQSDSGDGGFKYRWIKGLAQAIDPNFDRVNGDPNEAIKIIQSAKNLGAIYDDYKKVVKDQYNNITLPNDTDCNRKKVWGPRPDAVERMMGGEDHKTVLDDWEKTYIKKVTNQTANKSSEENKDTSTDHAIVLKYGTLKELLNSINNDEMGILGNPIYDTNKKVLINLKDGNFSLSLPRGKETLNSLKLAINIVSDHNSGVFPSKDSLQDKGYEVWDEGTFQLSGEGTRDWALMYK